MKNEYRLSYVVKDEIVVVDFDISEREMDRLAMKAVRNKSQCATDGPFTARVVERKVASK